jgi:HEAT repeat protein
MANLKNAFFIVTLVISGSIGTAKLRGLEAQVQKQCFDDLDRGFESEDIELVQSAKEAVSKIGSENIKDLINALKDKSRHKMTRVLIAEKLGELKSIDAIKPLSTVLEDQTEPKEVRYATADALGKMKNKEALESLLKIFSNKEEKEHNLKYVIAIGFRDNKELNAVDALIQALKDDDGMLRFKAAQVLGELKVQEAIKALEEVLKKDPDKTVRRRAARSLEAITGLSYTPE